MTPGAQADDKCLQQLTLFGGGTDRNLRTHVGTGGNIKIHYFSSATYFHTGGAVDGSPHLFGSYAQSGRLYSVLDGVVSSTAIAGSAQWQGPAPNGTIFLGSRYLNDAQWADAKFAVWGICQNPPSTGELTALHQYLQTNYGVAA